MWLASVLLLAGNSGGVRALTHYVTLASKLPVLKFILASNILTTLKLIKFSGPTLSSSRRNEEVWQRSGAQASVGIALLGPSV